MRSSFMTVLTLLFLFSRGSNFVRSAFTLLTDLPWCLLLSALRLENCVWEVHTFMLLILLKWKSLARYSYFLWMTRLATGISLFIDY